MRGIALLPFLILVACEDANFNIYTIEDDIEIGLDVKAEIEANPADFPVVYEDEAPEAYDHLYRVRDAILESGEVDLANEFDWEIYLIDDRRSAVALPEPAVMPRVATISTLLAPSIPTVRSSL